MKSILQIKLSHAVIAVLFVISMFASERSEALCTASFNSFPDSIGTGVNFTSTSTGTTGNTTYWWTFGDGWGSYNQNDYHTYALPGWYQVCLLITDSANGCSSTFCDSVFAGPNVVQCQALFTFQSNGLTTSFLSQSTGINLNYHWDFGDGAIMNNQNATHTYAIAGQYLVCLTVSNFNCSDTLCQYVTVTGGGGGNCQASFIAIDSSGTTYFFSQVTGTQGVVTYSWDFGDGTFGSSSFETHVYNGTGYVACLTITDTDTSNQTIICTSTFCDSIIPGGSTSSCQAAFGFTAGFSTGEIDFTDQSTATDSIIGWTWDFGDGYVGTGSNLSHIYSQGGNYYACLTITVINQNGVIVCTSTACNWVQVLIGGGACQAAFISYDSLGYYVFANTSTGINVALTSFYWDFGDGSTSTSENPTHFYTSQGPWLVCLTVSDSVAGCYSTICDSVGTVNNGFCQAAIIAIPDSAGNGFYFYDASTGTNGMTTYTWSISDGTTATGTSFHHNFAAAGWYQVCLTITVFDSLQNVTCTSNACDSIYVVSGGGTACNASWGYQVNLFNAYFADLSTGTDTIVSWAWDFGDGNTSTLQNPVHTYTQSGYYYVCLTIETASNGSITCTDTYCQSIYAGQNNNGCQANFSMFPDSSGMGFQFQNISTGTTASTSYNWSFGDGNYDTGENPFHTYTATGAYVVCLTITDTTVNCSSTVCDSIYVGSSFLCNAYFVWNGDTSNGVQFYQFNNNLPGMEYHWDFGDGDSSNVADPFHQYASSGTYYACLTVYDVDTNGTILCGAMYCDSIYAGANGQACAPQITAVPDSNGWGNGNMNFYVYSPCGNPTSITWDFGDSTTGTGNNPSHQYAATGWYIVCVDIEINGIIYTQCDSIFALRMIGIEEASGDLQMILVYPNPASALINVSYSLVNAHQVVIQLYDVTGRLVQPVDEQRQSAGSHHTIINLESISNGVYTLKISADQSVSVRRIVVNR